MRILPTSKACRLAISGQRYTEEGLQEALQRGINGHHPQLKDFSYRTYCIFDITALVLQVRICGNSYVVLVVEQDTVPDAYQLLGVLETTQTLSDKVSFRRKYIYMSP